MTILRTALSIINTFYKKIFKSSSTLTPFQRTIKCLLFEAYQSEIESLEIRFNQISHEVELILHNIEGNIKKLDSLPAELYREIVLGLLPFLNLDITDCSDNILRSHILKLDDDNGNIASWELESTDLINYVSIKPKRHDKNFNLEQCQIFSK